MLRAPRPLLAALLGIAGCANEAAPTPTPSVPESPAQGASDTERPGSSEATAASPGAPADRLSERAEQIMAEISTVRGLAIKRPVAAKLVSRPWIRAFAERNLHELTPPELLEILGAIDQGLGVFPPSPTPEQVLLDLLEDGVLGLYDPLEKTLVVGDFVPPLMLPMVLGHELAHGLQDMHFDLRERQKPLEHRSDEETARTFLIEGDAQATYLAWVSRGSGLSAISEPVLRAMENHALDLPAAASPYPVLARRLQMPYAQGTTAVIRIVQQSGWDSIDALYRDPPKTTEQLLHIEKLLSREEAIPVDFRAGPLRAGLPEFNQVWRDQLGEAALLSMLATVHPPALARRAASGWGGDTLVALRPPDDPKAPPLLMAAIVWDREREAADFATAFQDYIDEYMAGAIFERRKNTTVLVTRLGTAPPPQAMTVAWESLRVPRRGRSQPRKPRPHE